MKKFWGIILLMVMLISTSFVARTEAKSLDSYSTKAYSWGVKMNKKHKLPTGVTPKSWNLEKDSTYYYGAHSSKKKVVYLTFDCTTEKGYTTKILDTLKKKKVKAIFFVTEKYIKKNAKIVKRMKKEGHLVGNYTATSPRMANLSVVRIQSEIENCEDTMKAKTGYKMDRFLRPPDGNFSERSIKVTKDLGYSTILWSLNYYDYNPKCQLGKTYTVNQFKDYHHNGMISQMSTVSKSNNQALADVIAFLKKKGYKFGKMTDFVKAPKTSSSKEIDKNAKSMVK